MKIGDLEVQDGLLRTDFHRHYDTDSAVVETQYVRDHFPFPAINLDTIAAICFANHGGTALPT